jgi:hypothetical protein
VMIAVAQICPRPWSLRKRSEVITRVEFRNFQLQIQMKRLKLWSVPRSATCERFITLQNCVVEARLRAFLNRFRSTPSLLIHAEKERRVT